jgi:hypothetical protein
LEDGISDRGRKRDERRLSSARRRQILAIE